MWSSLVENFKGDLAEFVGTVTSDATKAIHSATENFLPTDEDDDETTSPSPPSAQSNSLLPPNFVLESEENFTGEILGGIPEAIADYDAFTQARQSEGPQVIAEQQASFDDVIEADVTLAELRAKLVPDVVTPEEFTNRYFYLRNKLRLQQLLRKEPDTAIEAIEASAEEQVGWGDDDDDEEGGWGSSSAGEGEEEEGGGEIELTTDDTKQDGVKEDETTANSSEKRQEADIITEATDVITVGNDAADTAIDANVDLNVYVEQIEVLKKELASVKKEAKVAKDQASDNAISADLNFQTLKVTLSDVKQKLEKSEAQNLILEKENETLRSELAAATVASAISAAAAANAAANVALMQSSNASSSEVGVTTSEDYVDATATTTAAQDTSVTNPFIAVTDDSDDSTKPDVTNTSKLSVTDTNVDAGIGNVDSAYVHGDNVYASTSDTNGDSRDVNSVSGGAKLAATDASFGHVSTPEYSAGAKDTGEVAVHRSNAQSLSQEGQGAAKNGEMKDGLNSVMSSSSSSDDDCVDVDVDDYMRSRMRDDNDVEEDANEQEAAIDEDVNGVDVDVDGEEADGWDAWE